MDRNIFMERERALEAAFFSRVDAELLAKLRKQLADEAARRALASASGLKDEALLDELVQMGISPETLGSLWLAPLVLVAWADRRVDEKERKVILDVAAEEGVQAGSPAYALLEFWLDHEPTPEMLTTWSRFAQAVMEELTPDARETMRNSVLRQARRAAKASGGILSGGKISLQERKVLDEIEAALAS